jgi:hypothetical protein
VRHNPEVGILWSKTRSGLPPSAPKRWLFIGHPDAGWRSAVLYSLLGSCRRRGVNPNDYLTDVLRRLPNATVSEIDSLLPANWKPHPD